MRDRTRSGEEIALDKAIGIALRTARIEHGLSQQAVAAGAKITFQQLQKYEEGRNRVSVSRLYTICRTIGIRVPDVLHQIDHDPLAGIANTPLLSRATGRQALDLMRAFQSMKQPQREALSRLANVIATAGVIQVEGCR